MKRMIALVVLLGATDARAQVATFDDLPLPGLNAFFNGSSNVIPPATISTAPFVSGGATFNNRYDTQFGGFWSGWSYSNVMNATTPGFGNQYASFSGGGDGSLQYAVGYQDFFTPNAPTITLPVGTRAVSARITNTTYTALSIRDGDGFSDRFGGPTGNDPDYFLLNIRGFDAANAPTGTVPFYLADYRFSNNAQDYILSQWTTVDLTALGNAVRLSFELESTRNGFAGPLTPTYLALDNLVFVPEPGSLVLSGVVFTSAWLRRRWSVQRRAG